MGVEVVAVRAGGSEFTGWTSVEVTAAIKDATRTFRLEVTEQQGPVAAAWDFPPGTPVDVVANGDLLARGYVDTYAPRYTATSHSVTVSGRGKGADAADSSAVHPTGHFEDMTILEIAKVLDKYGIGFDSDQKLVKEPLHRINQGETTWASLRRLAQKRGLVMMGRADGSVIITRAGTRRHAGELRLGHNIKEASATLSMAGRFQKTTAKGQEPSGTDDKALRPQHTAVDAGVRRYREKVLIVRGRAGPKEVRSRAEHEKRRRAGEGLKAQVTVQGFRDDAGVLWEPNRLVFVHDPFLKISQDMLIEGVTFTQSDGGSLTRLSLVDPRAHGGKKPGKTGSGPAWNQPG